MFYDAPTQHYLLKVIMLALPFRHCILQPPRFFDLNYLHSNSLLKFAPKMWTKKVSFQELSASFSSRTQQKRPVRQHKNYRVENF